MNTEFTKRWMNTRVSQTYDALVIGGGAAGMLAAGTAAARGLRTCLVEKNARPGRKLMITGKGRCNVTNDCDVQELIASVPSNGRFLYSAASAFPPRDVMAFFEAQGLPLKVERGNRVFPTSDHAVDRRGYVDPVHEAQWCGNANRGSQTTAVGGWHGAGGGSCRAAHAFWPGMCWLRAAVCRIQGRAPRGMAMRLHVRLAISSRRCAPRWCPWWLQERTARR